MEVPHNYVGPFVFAVDRDQSSMCYSKEVPSSTQHVAVQPLT